MPRRARDTDTMWLFTGDEPRHEPPRVTVDYGPDAPVRTQDVSQTIAKAVSQTLADDGRSREDIAAAMSDYLSEQVSKAMLDAYASPARETHAISLERAIALMAVTRDARLIGEVLPKEYAVIPAEYLPAIRAAYARQQRKRWEAIEESETRAWTGGRR